jgi:Leucine-rich repeat (LRR) protein
VLSLQNAVPYLTNFSVLGLYSTLNDLQNSYCCAQENCVGGDGGGGGNNGGGSLCLENYIANNMPQGVYQGCPCSGTEPVTWPRNLQRWSNLRNLLIDNCRLQGPIPSGAFATFKHLRILSLALNNLGSFPRDIGALNQLTLLRLQGSGLTGTLPNYFGNLPVLRRINFQSNRFHRK